MLELEKAILKSLYSQGLIDEDEFNDALEYMIKTFGNEIEETEKEKVK